MKPLTLALVVLLGCPALSGAQIQPGPAWTLVASQTADLATTQWALTTNPDAREGNGLMRDGLVVKKLAAIAGTMLTFDLIDRLAERRPAPERRVWRATTKWARYAIAAATVVVAVRNGGYAR